MSIAWLVPAWAALIALAPFAAPAQPGGSAPDGWQRLWRKSGSAPPAPLRVDVSSMPDLDLDAREWLAISTRHHDLYYDSSADAKVVREVYELIDNVYDFLAANSPEKPKAPVRVFLVPRERGRSRCSPQGLAMRTGADADAVSIVSSLLHEETHLFNAAVLGDQAQDWWAGEFSCVYFQERTRLAAQGTGVKPYVETRVPRGPKGRLAELGQYGARALDDAFAALYFLEETYGRTRLNEFRAQCLRDPTKRGAPRLLEKVYGKDAAALDAEWRSFYGWGTGAAADADAAGDPLQAHVTYASPKSSVQSIVRELARQAGLGYNFEKSLVKTDEKCRRPLFGVSIDDRPFDYAVRKILEPVKLRYEIEDGAVVLYPRKK